MRRWWWRWVGGGGVVAMVMGVAVVMAGEFCGTLLGQTHHGLWNLCARPHTPFSIAYVCV